MRMRAESDAAAVAAQLIASALQIDEEDAHPLRTSDDGVGGDSDAIHEEVDAAASSVISSAIQRALEREQAEAEVHRVRRDASRGRRDASGGRRTQRRLLRHKRRLAAESVAAAMSVALETCDAEAKCRVEHEVASLRLVPSQMFWPASHGLERPNGCSCSHSAARSSPDVSRVARCSCRSGLLSVRTCGIPKLPIRTLYHIGQLLCQLQRLCLLDLHDARPTLRQHTPAPPRSAGAPTGRQTPTCARWLGLHFRHNER